MPNTACENGNMSTLYKLLSDQFPNASLSTVQRKYFNEAKGTFFTYLFIYLFILLETAVSKTRNPVCCDTAGYGCTARYD